MTAVRYYIALFVVAFTPGIYLYWFSIHPFIGFWRRVGPRWTLSIHYLLMVIVAGLVVLRRDVILAVDFGTRPVLIIAALFILALSGMIKAKLSKELSLKVMMGLPELSPERADNRLITAGIYSRIRHPRYVQLLLAFLAYALLTNYLAVYVVFAMGLVWMRLVVAVEEKELRSRFGEAYDRYCDAVPRFIPRRRQSCGSASH